MRPEAPDLRGALLAEAPDCCDLDHRSRKRAGLICASRQDAPRKGDSPNVRFSHHRRRNHRRRRPRRLRIRGIRSIRVRRLDAFRRLIRTDWDLTPYPPADRPDTVPRPGTRPDPGLWGSTIRIAIWRARIIGECCVRTRQSQHRRPSAGPSLGGKDLRSFFWFVGFRPRRSSRRVAGEQRRSIRRAFRSGAVSPGSRRSPPQASPPDRRK